MSAADAPRAAAFDLTTVAVEIEEHADAGGWDQPPRLYALVDTAELAAREPTLAASLGAAAALTPIEQEALPDGDLADVLAGIAWPDDVRGCALVNEIVMLPPSVSDAVPDDAAAAAFVAAHPERREARLCVAVLRDGSRAACLRLRGATTREDKVLTGADLVPNLAAALLQTLDPVPHDAEPYAAADASADDGQPG
ncbi:MAG: PPA1309 family protein [Mycobacteriales bacterium]|nr:hypothetical protein [Frankia sp.]